MTDEQRVVSQRLARRIRALREQADMTQEELAAKLCVTPSAVQHIERGRRQRKFPELGEIARALGVTTDVLREDPGYIGEPVAVRGAGKAGAGGSGTAEKVSA